MIQKRLSLFKNLSPKELWATILISTSAAFLLCGYEILRSSTQSLFQANYGTEKLPLITALMPLGVIFLLYIYAVILSYMGSKKTLLITTLLSGLVMCIGYFYVQQGEPLMTGFLYIFREAYVVLIIEQYWSFINSIFGGSTARKLNGPIAGLSSLGAISGGMLLHTFAQRFGTEQMLLLSACSVLPAALFSHLAYAKCGEPAPTLQEKEGKQGHLGLGVLRSSPVLSSLLILVMTTQILSTVLMLSFQTTLHDAMPNMDAQTAYSGQFYALLNGFSFVLQFIAAPILMNFLPLGLIHLSIPFVHLSCAFFLFSSPSLHTAGIAYLTFKAIDYSLFRATKETLYIPLSFDARYRAKELIDVFGYRFSKGGTSLIITGLQASGWLTHTILQLYSWIALGASVGWLLALVPILKHLPKFKR